MLQWSVKWLVVVLVLSVAATPGWSQAPVQPKKLAPADFVMKQDGQLPVILSGPHGGQIALPGVSARKGDGLTKGPSGFFTGRDVNTDLLAVAIAEAIETKMGKKPYYVVARFGRSYIDANRPADIALESPEAK